MIPAAETELLNDFEIVVQPSKTYQIQGDRIAGYIDNAEAVKQAIFLILNTERFIYSIYSWNYGHELVSLIGLTAPLVCSRIKNRISEALLQDDRITEVSDFEFLQKKNFVQVSFLVTTIFNEQIEANWEVVV